MTKQSWLKYSVWLKGQVIPGLDSKLWRRDQFGWIMHFPDYGNRSSAFGWEIDHTVPEKLGGPDIYQNYQPLHWQNNARRIKDRVFENALIQMLGT